LPNYWLFIERLENWKVDQAEGFRRFGIPERKAPIAASIKKGDLLIFYVSSGVSALADVRQAIADGTSKLGSGGSYDLAYPLCVKTRPHLTLKREQWVPIADLVADLSFTRDRRDWRQVMRNTLRPLVPEDARLIVEKMEAAGRGELDG
jgi:predicted RNA-binding protein